MTDSTRTALIAECEQFIAWTKLERDPAICQRFVEKQFSRHCATCGFTHDVHLIRDCIASLTDQEQADAETLRKALRNVRLSAAAARTFGHSGTPTLEAQIAKKNDKLDHILRYCAEAGETGSILRADDTRNKPEPTRNNEATCSLCGHPMPPGEGMFKFHGYSGPCPVADQEQAPPAPQKETKIYCDCGKAVYWCVDNCPMPNSLGERREEDQP